MQYRTLYQIIGEKFVPAVSGKAFNQIDLFNGIQKA